MNPQVDPHRDELFRKAAAGTLSAAERQQLELHLRAHPEQRAEIEWDEVFAQRLEEKVAAMPALPGWQRTQRILDTEAAATAAARGPGVLDRLSNWFASTLGFGFNAQAVALALLVVQVGVIGALVWQVRDRDDHGELRGTVQDPTPRGPLLRVSFKQDLREADLRRALADVGGEIVGGPGQLGVYLVRIQAGDLGAAAARLRAGGSTELVEVVEARR